MLLHHDFKSCRNNCVFLMLGNTKKEYVENEYSLVIELRMADQDFHTFKKVAIHEIVDGRCAPYKGRRVHDQFNFDHACSWVRQFSSHTADPESADDLVPGFRVIDVIDKCVVPINGPQGCRFLALSYVWGGPQEFQNLRRRDKALRQPGSLAQTDNPLPQTIQDAIEFTEKIGERYLWVDSLCIIQDDGESKMKQINSMDQIYSKALLTIVALHGSSCHDGLPGVQPNTRRWKQLVVEVRGIKVANAQERNSEDGPVLAWPTRGWTFQEHALSLRCIHFALEGVTFESEDGISYEDVYPPFHDSSRPPPPPNGIPVSGANTDVASNIQLYAFSASFYSNRTLSFQADALNAFKGILNIMLPRFRRELIFGMPSSELELALLWQPMTHFERRLHDQTREKLFPSWAWLGWKGFVEFPVFVSDHFSRIKWVDASDNNTTFTSEDWRGITPISSQNWKQVPGRVLRPQLYEEADSPGVFFAHPVSATLPETVKSRTFTTPESPAFHILTFWAWTTRMRSRPGKTTLQGKQLVIPHREVAAHDLYDSFDRLAGVVHFHGGGYTPADFYAEPAQEHILDLVIISRTSFGEGNESPEPPPHDDHDVRSITAGYAERQQLRVKSEQRKASEYWDDYDFELKWQAYDVLVVKGGYDGVYERIGVGVCLIEAFWEAPRWERVAIR